MSRTLLFAAELLSASCAALARQTATRLVDALPDVSRYGADPLQLWREHMEGRLSDLCLALQSDDPERFAEQVAWAKLAFAAREVPTSDLQLALVQLAGVLDEQLPAEAAAVARAPLDAALARWDELGTSPPTSDLDLALPQGSLSARFLMALLEGDRRGATSLVTEAVVSGQLSVVDALLDVCLPACKELGRMWHLDEITIAEEHFVTRTTLRLSAALTELAAERVPFNGKTVLGASLAGDDHDLGLQVICDLLEIDGWRVICLGCNVPVEDLVWAAETYDVDLVLMSATLPRHVPSLGEAIQGLRGLPREVPVLVGGPAFAGHAEAARGIDADALANSARDVSAQARALVGLAEAD